MANRVHIVRLIAFLAILVMTSTACHYLNREPVEGGRDFQWTDYSSSGETDPEPKTKLPDDKKTEDPADKKDKEPPITEVIVPSKLNRIILQTPDIVVRDYEGIHLKNFRKHHEIARDIKGSGFTDVMLPVNGLHHSGWVGNPSVLLGENDGKMGGCVYFNMSAIADYVPVNDYFSRRCPDDKKYCSAASVLDEYGIGVIPHVLSFSGACQSGRSADKCDVGKKTNEGEICPTSNCPVECLHDNRFRWQDDEYWKAIFITFQNVARYACSEPNPRKVVSMDMESYWSRSQAGDPWSKPKGMSQEEFGQAIFKRAQEVSRIMSTECPGLDIFVYKPEVKNPTRAWLAGMAAPDVGGKQTYDIGNVYYYTSPYYLDTTMSYLYDIKRHYYDVTWGLMPETIDHYKLPHPKGIMVDIEKRARISVWPQLYAEPFYAGSCYANDTKCIDIQMEDGQTVNKCYKKFKTKNYFERNTLFGRKINFAKRGLLSWFDVSPEYVTQELEMVKDVYDSLIFFQGPTQLLCGENSESCPDIFDDVWVPNLTYQEGGWLLKQLKSCLVDPGEEELKNHLLNNETTCVKDEKIKVGGPSCFSKLEDYLGRGTLSLRADVINAEIKKLRQPVSYKALENDEIQIKKPRYLSDKKSWKDVSDRKGWEVSELDVEKLCASCRRRYGTAGEPASVLEIEGTDENESRVSEVFTWGANVSRADKPMVDDRDVDIEVLARIENPAVDRLIFEGTEIPLDKKISVEASDYDGWYWVRIARRFLSASRYRLRFDSPGKGFKTAIGGVRFAYHTDGKPEMRKWQGLEMQEWNSGQGWSRTSTGALHFDPAIALAINKGDKSLPFTTEVVAIPGRPTVPPYASGYFQGCMLIKTDGKARFEVHIPVGGNEGFPIQEIDSAGKNVWKRLSGNFTFSTPKNEVTPHMVKKQWRIRIKPLDGTAPFTIDQLKLVIPKDKCDPSQ